MAGILDLAMICHPKQVPLRTAACSSLRLGLRRQSAPFAPFTRAFTTAAGMSARYRYVGTLHRRH